MSQDKDEYDMELITSERPKQKQKKKSKEEQYVKFLEKADESVTVVQLFNSDIDTEILEPPIKNNTPRVNRKKKRNNQNKNEVTKRDKTYRANAQKTVRENANLRKTFLIYYYDKIEKLLQNLTDSAPEIDQIIINNEGLNRPDLLISNALIEYQEIKKFEKILISTDTFNLILKSKKDTFKVFLEILLKKKNITNFPWDRFDKGLLSNDEILDFF